MKRFGPLCGALRWLPLLVATTPLCAQVYLERAGEPVVEDLDGRVLPLAWAGGMIHAHAGNADLDGVPPLDLALFDKSGNRWLLLIADGAGGWTPDFALAAHWPAAEVFALVADYDGDGDADVLSYRGTGLVAWRNDRSETGEPGFTAYNGGRYLRSVVDGLPQPLVGSGLEKPAFADADGDGDLDLLRFDGGGAFVALHRNRSLEGYGHRDSLVFERTTDCWGRFRENATDAGITLDTCGTGLWAGGGSARPHLGSALMLDDQDGDGDADLAVGDSGSGRLALLRAVGNADAAVVDTVFPAWPPNDPAFVTLFVAPFAVDLNGDGRRDLLASPNAIGLSDDHRGLVAWIDTASGPAPAYGEGVRGWLQRDMLDFGSAAGPVAADPDGDGDPDLIVGNAGYRDASGPLPARLAWLENTGSDAPRFRLRDRDWAGVSALGLLEARPAFADLDGDGDPDLVVGDEQGLLHYFRNDGGAFGLVASGWQGIDVGSSAVPVFADLDGDGDPDLVVGEKNGNLNRYRNDGGVFSPVNDFWGSVDVRDGGSFGIGYAAPWLFDAGGGETGLLVGAVDGRIRYYDRLDPDAAAFPLHDSAFAGYAEGARAMPCMADFDGDGRADLVVGNASGGLAWFRSTGPTGLPSPEASSARVWPNPVRSGGSLRLEGPSAEGRPWRLHDATGRLAASGRVGPDGRLRLPALAAGAYALRAGGAVARVLVLP
jgi:hypothetical protein